MFPLDDISLRCSFFVLLCTTTLAAPGDLGSFAGSSATAFSSANSNAQAGSVANSISSASAASSAHAVSSANTFAGGFPHGGNVPSNNEGVANHGSIHHPSIFAGTGSYIGYGSNKPETDIFGLTHHQVAGNTGSSNSNDNKHHISCTTCQHKGDKWDKVKEAECVGEECNEQDEENEKESEEEEKSYDDGQYRPEHHYYEDGNNKQEKQTVSGIHKIGDNHSYNHNHQNVKGGHVSGHGDTNKQENTNDGSYYGNIGNSGGYGSKLNSNVGSTHSQTQDSTHLTSSWTDANKQKVNGHVNAGIHGSDKTNLDSTGTNAGCSNTSPGSNCGTSSTGSNQGPLKLDLSGVGNIGTQNEPHFPNNQNAGQWPSTGSTGNKPSSLDQQSTEQWPGNKPSSLGQQPTGQWPSTGNKPSLSQKNTGQWTGTGNKPSLDQQSTGQWPGAGNKPSSLDQQSTGQRPGNKPSSLGQQPIGQWPGTANKPSLSQQNTGQWTGTGNKESTLNQQTTGQYGIHHGTQGPDCVPGESSAPYPNEGSTLQKTLPIPTQTYGGIVGGASYPNNKNTGTQDTIHGGVNGHSGTYYPGGNKDSHTPVGISTPSTGQAGNIGSPFPHSQGTTGFPQNGIGIKQPIGSSNCGTFGGTQCTTDTKYPGITGVPGSQIGDGYVDKDVYQINTANPFLFDVQGSIKPLIHTTISPVHIPNYIGTIETTMKPIGLGNPFLDGTLGIGNSFGTQNTNTDKTQGISNSFGTQNLNTDKTHGISNSFGTQNINTDKTHGISNSFGTQSTNTDKSDHNTVVTSTETLNKPIGADNPFLIQGQEHEQRPTQSEGHGQGHGQGQGHGHGHGHGHAHGHNKGDSPIYNLGITIGGTQPTSALQSVTTTTVKPIGIDNPFFQQPGGNGMNKQPHDDHSGGIQGDKHTVSGSGTTYPASPTQSSPPNKDSINFPKVGNGATGGPSSDIYQNVNQGVKGGVHHNKEFGSNANSNAGVWATGNINKPNIPGAHNDGSSLGGNVNKPTNSFSTVPGSYDHKVTPQPSGNANNQYNPQVPQGNAGIYQNINQGVKGGTHHNKEVGNIATGNVNTPNIPGTHHDYNNVGHDGSSLGGTANKPTNPLLNVPHSYDYTATPQASGTGGPINNKGTSESNALNNGNNVNNQYNPQVANDGALSLATASAGANGGANSGSYSSSFSSSQASSSSFAASQSASYAGTGDLSGIMQKLKETWPFDVAKNINLNNSWSNATAQASSFAANNSGRWSGSHPVGVKSR